MHLIAPLVLSVVSCNSKPAGPDVKGSEKVGVHSPKLHSPVQMRGSIQRAHPWRMPAPHGFLGKGQHLLVRLLFLNPQGLHVSIHNKCGMEKPSLGQLGFC